MNTIPTLGITELDSLYELVAQLKADEITTAGGKRGRKGARTRMRTKLAKIGNLCRSVRKQVPPVGSNPYWRNDG